jgi:hypothetical protein
MDVDPEDGSIGFHMEAQGDGIDHFGKPVRFEDNVTIDGVLDITQRRCYATLSSAGWYRIIQYNAIANNEAIGLSGRIFDIRIVRRYAQTNNEVHKITLLNPYNSFRFVDESSASNNNLITKIRATYNSTTHVMYIDVYYNASSTNNIAAFFDMYSAMEVSQSRCVSVAFDAVADAPSGETVLTTYEFGANYHPRNASTLNPSSVARVEDFTGNTILPLYGLLTSGGVAIASGDNLNNYKTVGTYYAGTNQIVSSLSNKPSSVTSAFKLIVMNVLSNEPSVDSASWQYFMQILIVFTGDIYIRSFSSSSSAINYGSWKKITMGTA